MSGAHQMWPISLFVLAMSAVGVQNNPFRECGKLFNPANYMDQLPSLNLPYVSSLPIAPPIKPSPVVKTKVINVVTKYVYKNPVCVKITGNKSMCKSLNPQNSVEHLVTKEYFVKDRKKQLGRKEDDLGLLIQGSEEPRPFSKQGRTPKLFSEDVKEMLIEDRLDQLETVLPQYTRRRTYQTSTITVTKVRSNNRATATLLVKNCVPQGYDLCPPKQQRRSKIAKVGNSTEQNYFG